MKHIPLALLCGALAITGCTGRFQDDFEVDTVGAAPDVAPDGMPDDQIFVNTFSGGSVVVTNSSPIAGAQSLEFGGPTGQFGPTAYMYAEEIADTSEEVSAFWMGRLSDDASVRINFFTGHFTDIVVVLLEDGDIEVNGAVVGTYTPNQVHTISMSANPATDRFSFAAAGAVSPGSSTSGPVSNPGSFPQSNIGLVVELTSGGTYVMDTVRMSEDNP